MSNAPDRYEKFVVPEGVEKCAPLGTPPPPPNPTPQYLLVGTLVRQLSSRAAASFNRVSRFIQTALWRSWHRRVSCVKDTKIENAATLTIQREDHTVGNVLRMQLHRDKHVLFAGYKIPHPLEHRLIVKVQTDGRKTPEEAVSEALINLHEEFTDIRNQFETEASAVRQPQDRGY